MMAIVAAMMITIITIINHDLLNIEALKGLFFFARKEKIKNNHEKSQLLLLILVIIC